MKFAILLISFGFASISIAANDMPVVTQATAVEGLLTEEMIFGLRDPFKEPDNLNKVVAQKNNDLELFPVRSMVLNGVISGLKTSKAMLTLPNSKTVFVKVGDKIGVREGRVIAINGDGVRVMEYDRRDKRNPRTEYVTIAIAEQTNSEGRGAQ